MILNYHVRYDYLFEEHVWEYLCAKNRDAITIIFGRSLNMETSYEETAWGRKRQLDVPKNMPSSLERLEKRRSGLR